MRSSEGVILISGNFPSSLATELREDGSRLGWVDLLTFGFVLDGFMLPQCLMFPLKYEDEHRELDCSPG